MASPVPRLRGFLPRPLQLQAALAYPLRREAFRLSNLSLQVQPEQQLEATHGRTSQHSVQ
ncbi:UNVERIFIED_CONTAM: hypothetical protein GTU68_008892 [Idotea baltica]|nr:hypothetical protein [Idotea baltica]